MSDRKTNYTYISLSNASSSVIDLVQIDSQCVQSITDFSVQNFSNFSDHLLCIVDIALRYDSKKQIISANSDSLKITRWNNKFKDNYVVALSNQFGIYYNSSDTNDLADNLQISILDAMDQAGMSKITYRKNSQLKYLKTPWFNEECKVAKKAIETIYKILLKNNYNTDDFENLL